MSDSAGTYAEIIGNGTASTARSNARTLDWEGNEWVAGTMTADGGLVFGSSTVKTLGSGLAVDADGVLSVDLSGIMDLSGMEF
ncbi:hypothetical protein [Atopobium sp. oral taxon 810]|uniref:hypothetical protein n=1 Tax=Atopobium sp. oral taxon 810 TaxID=712158 RepID=UPI0003971650|nr:hypothetical protein [Atopobium sp. oral taxon 810]ERI04010.1 hypothetical protein HMPREF9069_01775 [Atopobium sp. oral taxon 810 str. F0209]